MIYLSPEKPYNYLENEITLGKLLLYGIQDKCIDLVETNLHFFPNESTIDAKFLDSIPWTPKHPLYF